MCAPVIWPDARSSRPMDAAARPLRFQNKRRADRPTLKSKINFALRRAVIFRKIGIFMTHESSI
jgi:hypothetical protein